MLRRLVLAALALTACARGRTEEPVVDGATSDAPKLPDAATTPDSPTTSGTCSMAFTGTLASWSFAGELGSQASTAVTTKAAGVTASAVTRSAGLTATSGSGSINSSNWALTAARDLTKYYAFTIAPPAGCSISLTGAAVDALSSGTGPVSAAISNSTDTYGTTTAVSTTTAGTVAFTAMANGMIEVRVYGYAAAATGGTFRLRNTLSISGELK